MGHGHQRSPVEGTQPVCQRGKGGGEWDRALGSETGRRTDHVTPSNSEPNRCSSSAFTPSFLLPSSFIPSARPSTPPAAANVTHFPLVLPPPPHSSFSHRVLSPARHAASPFRFYFRLCPRPRPRPRPAARFRAAAPPTPLTYLANTLAKPPAPTSSAHRNYPSTANDGP